MDDKKELARPFVAAGLRCADSFFLDKPAHGTMQSVFFPNTGFSTGERVRKIWRSRHPEICAFCTRFVTAISSYKKDPTHSAAAAARTADRSTFLAGGKQKSRRSIDRSGTKEHTQASGRLRATHNNKNKNGNTNNKKRAGAAKMGEQPRGENAYTGATTIADLLKMPTPETTTVVE